MLRLPLAAALLIAVAGCATAAPDATPDAGPFAYACAGGKTFTAAFDPATDRVAIFIGADSHTLPHVLSGSGARYADGAAQYWSKGRAAMLEGFPGGPYVDCVTR